MASLGRHLGNVPLREEQIVLALTFMHGSRQRLSGHLARVALARQRHECMTIDKFAWHLVSRWRGVLAAGRGGVADISQWSFDDRCSAAAELLARENVRSWICRRFPVVVVDELQDVCDARLSMIQSLAEVGHLIAAADGFQDLGGVGENAAVMWLRSIATPTPLQKNHRTAYADLLESASDLREGRPMRDRDRCKILAAANPNVAASMMACNLVWFGIRGTVVLSPTGPASSTFVRKAIERLHAKPINPSALKGTEVGPFRIDWESHASTDAEKLLEGLGLPADATDVDSRTLSVPQALRGGCSLVDWINRQRRVCGCERIPIKLLRQQIQRVCQELRSHKPPNDERLMAMTIHQAKNREFDRVIVLWPYEVSGCAEKVRRLLYNAITRAKQRAVVIVQNPPTAVPNRLCGPPFEISSEG